MAKYELEVEAIVTVDCLLVEGNLILVKIGKESFLKRDSWDVGGVIIEALKAQVADKAQATPSPEAEKF